MTRSTREAPDGEGEPGPDTAFADFYRHRFSSLVASGRARGLSVPEAEDDAQDAMVQIYEKWSELHPDARFAFARTATDHNIIDRWRKAGRWRKRLTEIGPRMRVAEPDTSGHTETLDLLRRRLTGIQLEVMFRLVAGLSVADIAVVLGLSPSTVRSHVHNARKALKEDDHG